MTPDIIFRWGRHPEGEILVTELLDLCRRAIPPFKTLAEEIASRTGTRILDWIDHFVLADGAALRQRLAKLSFEPDAAADAGGSWIHPGAIFPRLLLTGPAGHGGGEIRAVAVGVERVGDFLAAWRINARIEGTALSPLRRARIWSGDGLEMFVVERRAYCGTAPVEQTAEATAARLRACERWRARPRASADAPRGKRGVPAAMERTHALARSLAEELGADEAAWIALSAERDFWQSRNRAGRAQRACQDALGLGWANHDHHTFRSSREVFPILLQTLQTFGFRMRERFHAGAEAGWGAQVLEQPACRVTVFADVDLSPDEVQADFLQGELAARDELGTVGLWCALHGESLLEAGLHHLAVRSDFPALTRGLAGFGVEMLPPFSEFPFLQQAFTAGERWEVDPLRSAAIGAAISDRDRQRFAAEGAIGSHLENIQRGEGFKGFNQVAVSDIIRRTDPRGRGA